MPQLMIEKTLMKAGKNEGLPFYEKYTLLKERLYIREYPIWAMNFSGGYIHGPQHISRVLENLDCLLGKNPVERNLLSAYELFLSMMSILYHDISILRQQHAHPNISKDFLEQEKNDYLFDPHDKDIIGLAVVSHHGQNVREFISRSFSQEETIGNYIVRPRMIATLVRLADELDEDHRLVYPITTERIQLADESQFFWQFCQRIISILPDQRSLEIDMTVKFESEDIGREVSLDGNARPFLWAFAEKLVHLNKERYLLSRFLPKELQYHCIKVNVRLLMDN
jgi:hypothetical protein